MITLFLFGGAILFVALIQLVRRMRRSKTNPYDRFLRDRTIDEIRMEDLRTHKLRMATSRQAEKKAANPAITPSDEG